MRRHVELQYNASVNSSQALTVGIRHLEVVVNKNRSVRYCSGIGR